MKNSGVDSWMGGLFVCDITKYQTVVCVCVCLYGKQFYTLAWNQGGNSTAAVQHSHRLYIPGDY